jgi:hypothetical protein
MTSTTLRMAGCLAMANALLTIPVVYLSWHLEGRSDLPATLLQTGMQLLGAALFLVILLCFRRFIHDRFAFHAADQSINLLLKTTVVLAGLTVAALQIPPVKESAGIVLFILIAIQGIIQFRFGRQLRNLPDPLNGLLQPFCYANMVTGLLSASIVLIPVAVVSSAISDVMLGTIFFQAAGADQEPEA